VDQSKRAVDFFTRRIGRTSAALRKIQGMSAFIKIASRSELPPGGKKLVELDGQAIAVFNIDDVFYAIDDVCTHDGGPLADGKLIGCEIECPRHGARFDVRTGRPVCMPAIEPVDVHPVELRGDDIYVAIDD
jgi:3-phenylpropionate/trans-cinnamate dioxygenase ferredoxin component